MLIANTNGPAYRVNSGSEFDFECLFISYGTDTYIKVSTTNLVTDESASLEKIYDTIDEGICFLKLFLSKFKDYELKLLEFDKEYDTEIENELINKWRNE